MSPAQIANFMAVLGATLAAVRAFDRAECCANIGWNYAQQDAAAIEANKAARHGTALFTSHGYTAAPGSRCAAGAKRSGRPSGRRSTPGRSTRPGTTAHNCRVSLGRSTSIAA